MHNTSKSQRPVLNRALQAPVGLLDNIVQQQSSYPTSLTPEKLLPTQMILTLLKTNTTERRVPTLETRSLRAFYLKQLDKRSLVSTSAGMKCRVLLNCGKSYHHPSPALPRTYQTLPSCPIFNRTVDISFKSQIA